MHFGLGLSAGGADLGEKAPYAIVGFAIGLLLILSARTRARRRREKREARRTALEATVAKHRETARARLHSYEPLIRALSDALSLDPSASWSHFSEAYFRHGSFGEGLEAAFAGAGAWASFDWRDWDEFLLFRASAYELLGEASPEALPMDGDEDPVGTGIHELAAWLGSRDRVLLQCGADTDSYSCFVLARKPAIEIIGLASEGALTDIDVKLLPEKKRTDP